MKIALLISYWNNPWFLDLCLEAVSMQSRSPDEIVILDDASDLTKVEFFQDSDIYVRRHEHVGFGKERCANRALTEIESDYVIMLDQDTIIPPDFLAKHEAHAKESQAVCGMYTSLTEEESKLVSRETIRNQSIWKAITKRYESEPSVWCGSGSAVWRSDALKVNGFDNRFGIVGPDYNFGLRLARVGISLVHSSSWIRYLHLWHEKPYLKGVDKNAANDLARKWAKESHRANPGIAELDPNEFSVIKNEKTKAEEKIA